MRVLLRLVVLVLIPTNVLALGWTDFLNFSISPEVWYTKWQPKFSYTDDTRRKVSTAYHIKPVMLYGGSFSASYRDVGFVGSYLSYKSEDSVNSSVGSKGSTDLFNEVRGEIICRVHGDVYEKTRIMVGHFKGGTTGTEWSKSTRLSSWKNLPVDTDWFQGEVSFVWDAFRIRQAAGSGILLGYRHMSYSLPSQVEYYGPNWLENIYFLNTKYVTDEVLLGLSGLPDDRKGWKLNVTNMILGFGQTKVSNSLMSEKTSSNPVHDNGSISVEGDSSVSYTTKLISFDLGMRFRWSKVVAGKGGKWNHSNTTATSEYSAGYRVALEETYWGPYSRVTVHF